ncbi:4-hydroxy-tetrahydrodipicolinate reductase [Silanimonas algicola]
MTTSIDLLVHGASGRMGQRLLALSGEFSRLNLVAAVARGTAGLVVPEGVALPAMRLSEAPAFRLLIDFSLPEAFDAALALAVQRRAAFVSGTTGLSLGQLKALESASRQIPVLWSANFSLGVAVLSDLVERAARALPGWDLDIVESHHVHKKDAPSGTALALGASAKAGGAEPRYASLRAGDIVGEHWLQFASAGERVELAHRATSRDIFARGALAVGEWLAGQPPGHYAMRDWVAAKTRD